MTDTETSAPALDVPVQESMAGDSAGSPRTARRTSLSALRLPQLQALAAELGVPATAKMRKSDLLAAIREQQGGAPARAVSAAAPADAGTGDATGGRPVRQREGGDSERSDRDGATRPRRGDRGAGSGRGPAAAPDQQGQDGQQVKEGQQVKDRSRAGRPAGPGRPAGQGGPAGP